MITTDPRTGHARFHGPRVGFGRFWTAIRFSDGGVGFACPGWLTVRCNKDTTIDEAWRKVDALRRIYPPAWERPAATDAAADGPAVGASLLPPPAGGDKLGGTLDTGSPPHGDTGPDDR